MSDVNETRTPGEIVDEYIAGMNARIGETHPAVVVKKTVPGQVDDFFNTELWREYVTEDVIREHAMVTGDFNPLWRDKEYAENSVWHGMIGSPLFLYSMGGSPALPVAPNVKGWLGFAGGGIVEVFQPFRGGDKVIAEDVWLGYSDISKPGAKNRLFLLKAQRRMSTAERGLICTCTYTAPCQAPLNAEGQKAYEEALAKAAAEGAAADAPKKPKKHRNQRGIHAYTEEELDVIYRHYEDEAAGRLRRGNDPRFFEDVKVGDNLGTVLKGPINAGDLGAFSTIFPGRACADQYMWGIAGAPKESLLRDPDTNQLTSSASFHIDNQIARLVGCERAINFGVAEEMYCAHVLSNWMSDYGWVRKFTGRTYAQNLIGDTTVLTGTVTKVYEENGRGLVDVEVVGTEMSSNVKLVGANATIQLPHKGNEEEVVKAVLAGK